MFCTYTLCTKFGPALRSEPLWSVTELTEDCRLDRLLSVDCPLTFHIFDFSGTTGLNPTKLSTNHPRVKGIQDCSNEGPIYSPFKGGDNHENAKIGSVI